MGQAVGHKGQYMQGRHASHFCLDHGLGSWPLTMDTEPGMSSAYSLRGSSPRPMAQKTIALTTELREPWKDGCHILAPCVAALVGHGAWGEETSPQLPASAPCSC